ncbi:MAG: hypothetical protein ACI8P9_000016 [Parasphingorhabdus sp.]|jgi:hypothetical protein
MNQAPLFCFGSLMDWDVVACVLEENTDRLSMVSCKLENFRVARLPHEDYPMLVVDESRIASGQLLCGLSKAQLDRILFYEGEEYALAPCYVKLDSGETVLASFFSENNMPAPEMTDWCFETWVRNHKDYLLRQSAAYMSWYGKMSATDADFYWQTYSDIENDMPMAATG